MDLSSSKMSPFPSATDVPLHRNPPLAPSQEMAYRKKCIQLKRRLTEIETNNDATRKRIAIEKERVQKMRILRSIILNELKDIMSAPGKKLTPEQLSKLGIAETVMIPDIEDRLEGEAMLDDSSDDSDDEDVPEPSERPTRTRRNNNNYRETIMNTTPGAIIQTGYPQSGLPNLAPAGSYSPAAPRDSAPHPSSFHVASTPYVTGSPEYSNHSIHQQYQQDARYPQQSSPLQHHQLIQDPMRSAIPHETNGVVTIVQPIRPSPPFEQFHTHMRPQLEADQYPAEQIDHRIEEEWKKLSDDNRQLWEARYEEQMVDYQDNMNDYNRARRRR